MCEGLRGINGTGCDVQPHPATLCKSCSLAGLFLPYILVKALPALTSKFIIVSFEAAPPLEISLVLALPASVIEVLVRFLSMANL
jgi:hypothetical protein